MPAANNKKKTNIIRYAWYIVLMANIMVIAALFLSTMAWYVSPVKTAFFAYLGLGFVFILIAALLFLLFWIVFAKWKYVLINIVALLVFIIPISTYVPIHSTTKNIPDGCIKVLSYNIQFFKNDNNIEGMRPVLYYIKNSGADIVCVQEFLTEERYKNFSTKKLKKELKDYPYTSFIRLLGDGGNKSDLYGMACFSKFPILDATRIPIETRENSGAALYKIKIKDKVISVFNAHLESNRLTSEDRNMFKEKNRIADLDSIAKTIRKRLGSAYVKRAPQADMIDSLIRLQNTDGIIVCGDFNDTPISYTYHKIKGDLKDSYAETGFGPGITYNENKFWFRIDFILHSSNIKAYNCTVDKVKYSDHYPLWTYLKID